MPMLTSLPGVAAVTASAENGAPEVAWGDSFYFYDPGNDTPADRRFPFATIVVDDYPGFDTSSELHRPGVYRLNLGVGRTCFEQVLGFPPAAFASHEAEFDYTELDRVIPHPVYATQGWVSVLVPGPRTLPGLPPLIQVAYDRAKKRYRPPA